MTISESLLHKGVSKKFMENDYYEKNVQISKTFCNNINSQFNSIFPQTVWSPLVSVQEHPLGLPITAPSITIRSHVPHGTFGQQWITYLTTMVEQWATARSQPTCAVSYTTEVCVSTLGCLHKHPSPSNSLSQNMYPIIKQHMTIYTWLSPSHKKKLHSTNFISSAQNEPVINGGGGNTNINVLYTLL